jgi:hypothetical protein
MLRNESIHLASVGRLGWRRTWSRSISICRRGGLPLPLWTLCLLAPLDRSLTATVAMRGDAGVSSAQTRRLLVVPEAVGKRG